MVEFREKDNKLARRCIVYKLKDFLPNPDVPKMVQKREPFLDGTLREVGFGKSFAYKQYTSGLTYYPFHYIEEE